MPGISYIISSVGKSIKLNELLNIIIKNLNGNELILIDNSKNKILKNYMNNRYIHYYYEQISGLSCARNRGALEALSNLLVFLDDDILPNDSFFKVLETYSNNSSLNAIIGAKIISDDIPEYLPPKYHYMVGVKDYGNKKILLPKYTYLGGCVLIMNKKTFTRLNGFNTCFGHNGKNVGANEDVILQDVARKYKIDIIYDPGLIVKHYWIGNYESILKRLQVQGISDCLVDKKYHKIRFVLKYFKYNLEIFIKRKSQETVDVYDIMRYRSYVQNCKKKQSRC